jgi:hypothetical protein
MVEQWLEKTLNTRDVWFAPLEEIIGHVDGLRSEGSYAPRVEKLPYFDGPVS